MKAVSVFCPSQKRSPGSREAVKVWCRRSQHLFTQISERGAWVPWETERDLYGCDTILGGGHLVHPRVNFKSHFPSWGLLGPGITEHLLECLWLWRSWVYNDSDNQRGKWKDYSAWLCELIACLNFRLTVPAVSFLRGCNRSFLMKEDGPLVEPCWNPLLVDEFSRFSLSWPLTRRLLTHHLWVTCSPLSWFFPGSRGISSHAMVVPLMEKPRNYWCLIKETDSQTSCTHTHTHTLTLTLTLTLFHLLVSKFPLQSAPSGCFLKSLFPPPHTHVCVCVCVCVYKQVGRRANPEISLLWSGCSQLLLKMT